MYSEWIMLAVFLGSEMDMLALVFCTYLFGKLLLELMSVWSLISHVSLEAVCAPHVLMNGLADILICVSNGRSR